MQSTTSEKPTELVMWWPDPSALDDLTVEDAEHGWELSAPDDTECALWLGYWSQDEEHHKFFEQEFVKILIEHAEKTLEQHGESQIQSDRQNDHRVTSEDDLARVQSEHEPGSDTESAS